MDPSEPPPPTCNCPCLCCGPSSLPSLAWRRSLKRKLDDLSDDDTNASPVPETDIARVEVSNEAAALREALASHQQSIQELYTELEEERNASATAASEAMSMILRLQREKAEAQMEARQFRRFAEEKMAHDQQEIAALEDLLFKREQTLQSLSCEVQAYKHRLASYGIGPLGTITEPQTPESSSAAGATPRSAFDYPPLRCNTTSVPADTDLNDDASAAADLEKFPFGETPREHLQNFEHRINQLERMPSSIHVMEKGVVVGHSPRRPRHLRKLSVDSYGSFLVREPVEFNKGEEFPASVDRASDQGWRDDMSDRVYTIDAVHGTVPSAVCDEYESTPRELNRNRRDTGGGSVEEEEIKKLYMRLQALEADRESMRQAIISMGTDKAQMVLLREIAQQLCKPSAPEKKISKKPSFIRTFSIMTVIKCITSFVFWRKKSTRSKYTFGMTSNNAGLLLLLEKSPRTRQRKFLSRTQG